MLSHSVDDTIAPRFIEIQTSTFEDILPTTRTLNPQISKERASSHTHTMAKTS